MTKSEIREAVELVLVGYPGRFTGKDQKTLRAEGTKVIQTLADMAEADIQSAAVFTEESHGIPS
ncbi:MAG: hypothetical protein FJ379_10790 [Verrucomicrobia bacterium]|nr:hypothetical protein [Verrucomicrobiota bacterium]